MLVPRNGTVSDLLTALQKKANLDEDTIQGMRLFDVLGGKLRSELRGDSSVTNIPENSTIYAEKIPAEELHMEPDDRLINCFSFDREPSRTHGIPFKFVVKHVGIPFTHRLITLCADNKKGEVFKQTKERLSKRTGIKGKPFEKTKFAVVQRGSFSDPKYLEDGKDHPSLARAHTLTMLQMISCQMSQAQKIRLHSIMLERPGASGKQIHFLFDKSSWGAGVLLAGWLDATIWYMSSDGLTQ